MEVIEKKNQTTKLAIGKMSNLVGMYAIIVEGEEIRNTFYIKGKADDKYFIVQVISPFDGSANVSKLLTLEQMIDWYFFDKDTAEFVWADYLRVNRFRYKWPKEAQSKK